MPLNTSNESGRSMVEMLGVIAIIGVISIGGITSMSYVDSYFRTSATLLEVEQLARDINDMYSWAPDYLSVSTAALCKEDVVKNCSNNKVPNRWGGEILVRQENGGNNYSLTYTAVPAIACERIVEQAPESVLSMRLETANCANGDNNSVKFISR